MIRDVLSCSARAAATLLAVVLWPALPSSAITVISSGPNTTVTLGEPYGNLEFNNPLTGTETIKGCPVIEWRDAGFACPGPIYEDWAVSLPCVCPSPIPNTCVDGYANEIWLRNPGDAASTITTVPSTTVSIHLHGDNNDGVCDVIVDGVPRAQLDMFTAGADNALIIVDNLPNTTHTIEVIDLGPGVGGPGADDIAIMGAAALECFFWKGGSTSPMYDIDQKQGLWGDTCPPAGFVFTWCGPVAVANSVWWFDSYTTPGLVPPSLRNAVGNVDPVLLVEYLSQLAKGSTPGCNGVTCVELMGIAWQFFEQQVPGQFHFHTIPTRLDTMCTELKKSQDVILLLGFYVSDGSSVTRTGGHFVTLAGCGTTVLGVPAVAFSDPYFDSNAAGFSPGRFFGPHGDPRVGPSSPLNHNNPANYSHDLFTLTVTPGPGLNDMIQVDGYDDQYQEPFDGQNPGPEEPPLPPVLPPGSYTYIDWVFGISPKTVTGVEPDPQDVPRTMLRQNYPNPFNPGTKIEFVLASRAHVNLAIYDAAGRLVRTLVDEVRSGNQVHAVEWDGTNTRGQRVASGVYFYRLITGGEAHTRKMVYLR